MKKIISLSILLLLLSPNFSFADVLEPNNQLLIVNKANNKLAFYDNGILVKTFSVATGSNSSFTPEGDFTVIKMYRNMPYYKTNIPGGDPRNPLGTRWIGIDVPGTYGYTYGIHGNNAPWTIGTYASSGCVRMLNEEVEWLYERITLGARVLIVKESSTFNNIAKKNGYPILKIKKNSYEVFLLNETSTYKEAHFFNFLTNTIPPVKVNVFEEAGNFKHVFFNKKDFWINTTQFSTEEIKKKKKVIYLKKETPIFSSPNNHNQSSGKIPAGNVLTFEETKNWQHIYYTRGNAWIKKVR